MPGPGAARLDARRPPGDSSERREKGFRGHHVGHVRRAVAPRLTKVARDALRLIANDPRGINEELFVHGHGFSRALLGGLVRSGLVEVRREVVMAGDVPIQVSKVRITQAGRKAFAKPP